jgi:hypothetical protein
MSVARESGRSQRSDDERGLHFTHLQLSTQGAAPHLNMRFGFVADDAGAPRCRATCIRATRQCSQVLLLLQTAAFAKHRHIQAAAEEMDEEFVEKMARRSAQFPGGIVSPWYRG